MRVYWAPWIYWALCLQYWEGAAFPTIEWMRHHSVRTIAVRPGYRISASICQPPTPPQLGWRGYHPLHPAGNRWGAITRRGKEEGGCKRERDKEKERKKERKGEGGRERDMKTVVYERLRASLFPVASFWWFSQRGGGGRGAYVEEVGLLQAASPWRQAGWRLERHSFLMLFGRDHRRPLLSAAGPARPPPSLSHRLCVN